MTPEWPQARNCQKHNLYTECSPRGPNFKLRLSRYTTSSCQIVNKICQKSKCNQKSRPQTDLNHLTAKRPFIHWLLTLRPKFHSISLYDQPVFVMQGCRKSEMHQMTPRVTSTTHLTVKSVQISFRFAPRSLVFQITEMFWFPKRTQPDPTLTPYLAPCWLFVSCYSRYFSPPGYFE